MDTTPIVQEEEEEGDGKQLHVTEGKSSICNLLKANLVFMTYHLALNIRNPAVNQYVYDRYVHELEDNGTDVLSSNVSFNCFANKSDHLYRIHIEAEEKSNNLQVIFAYMFDPLGLISCIFLGSYSDYIGRKILFVIPLLGEAFRFAGSTVVMYWDLPLEYMYIGEGSSGITAGFYGVMLASYVYTADNTPPHQSRTIGIAFVDFTTYFAAAFSQVGTGYLIQYAGYVYPCLASTILTLLAVVFVVALLPETISPEKRALPWLKPTQAIKNVFGFYFSNRFGRKRGLFWLVVVIFFFNYFGYSGTAAIDYMLLLNQPFCWGPEKIGYYNMAFMLLKQLLGIGVIKLLHVCTSDEVIGIITSLLQAGCDALHGLAYTDLMLYASIVLGGLATGMLSVLRAIMSRMAPAEIQGSLFAGQFVLGIISYGIAVPVNGAVYDATLTLNRGFVYFMCSGTHVVAAVLIVVFIVIAKKILPEAESKTTIVEHSVQ